MISDGNCQFASETDLILQKGSSQIEVPVLHAKFVASICIIFYGKGGKLGSVENIKFGDDHFDISGWYIRVFVAAFSDRKSTRLNSSHVAISYAVFCLKKKTG